MTGTLPQTDFDVYATVFGTWTHRNDEHVAGIYLLTVVTDRPVDLDGLTEAETTAIAVAVKDSFHDHVGIKVLDDFTITFRLASGRAIDEDEIDDCLVGATGLNPLADFHGAVDADSVPFKQQSGNKTGVELVIEAARLHGENSDPDHEVGDLQDALRLMWDMLPSTKKIAFMEHESTIERLEQELPEGVDVQEANETLRQALRQGSR